MNLSFERALFGMKFLLSPDPSARLSEEAIEKSLCDVATLATATFL